MIEKYYKYKLDYRDYLIFIKCGSFYECIDNDAFIINKLFNYKIKKLSRNFKVGFPIRSFEIVLDKICDKKINYIVVDDGISEKKEFDNNNYSRYVFDEKEIYFNYIKIERVINYLMDNMMKKDFYKKIKKIEDVIYKSEND